MNPIELLAPAKDLLTARAAIDCGADALYMGAPRFGARAQAGNSLSDIESAVRYAHRYYARVYATVNTILTDRELAEAAVIIRTLYELGADGVIIQDMGLLETDPPPIPLIASTQCHNATWQKVKFLEDAGFRRVILARELSLDQIREIRSRTSVELETFVHGALCVSYSGQCYLSYSCGRRSGNRGVCAQPCRMTYDLTDKPGRVLVKDRHLLSLKDLNLSEDIGALLDAGVTSFKIEGRLKDIHYVRNIVSFYRARIDAELGKRNLKRSSSGTSAAPFIPDPAKTFNRGFTRYFLGGKPNRVASIRTQKSVGEPMGRVKTVDRGYLTLETVHDLKNGDGICFFDRMDVLCGMLITRVEGEKIFPREPGIQWVYPGAMIMRNSDSAFEKTLSAARITRRVHVRMVFSETGTGFILTAEDEDGNTERREFPAEKVTAENPAEAVRNIRRQLEKSGDTIFQVTELDIALKQPRYLPLKSVNEMRRLVLSALETRRMENFPKREKKIRPNSVPYPGKTLDFRANVLNRKAEAFYRRHGVQEIEPAAESGLDLTGRPVMTAKYCVHYELGWCLKDGKKAGRDIPEGRLFLRDGRNVLRLEFDCAACEMRVIRETPGPSLDRNARPNSRSELVKKHRPR